MREFIHLPQRVDDILYSSLIARLASGALCASVAVGIFDYWSQNSQYTRLFAVLMVGQIFLAFNVYDFWFQSELRNKPAVVFRMIAFSIFALVKIYSVFSGLGLFIVIWVTAVEIVLTQYGHMLLFKRVNKQSKKGRFSLKLVTNIFSQSKFLVLSGFASIIYLKVDVLMLEHLSSSYEVGVYSTAAKISEVWYLFPEAIVVALFPKLLRMAKNQPSKYLCSLQSLFNWLFLFAFIIAVVITILAPFLILLLFGDNYAESVLILQIHVWGGCLVFMRSLLSQWLVAERFAQFSLLSHGLGAVSNVLINFYLIPLYGGVGAAIATIVSYVFSTYICLFFTAKTRPIASMMGCAMLSPFTVFFRAKSWRI